MVERLQAFPRPTRTRSPGPHRGGRFSIHDVINNYAAGLRAADLDWDLTYFGQLYTSEVAVSD
ncbi:hypothetical protein [Geodermatophilus sp. URMC 62]|uniref:hypothetical protein n=1 Tax=Geodermatophilus sp. URMC 62 TaxID=3423414 RepID=UPI00406C9E49